jgi:hypothetical protein
MGSGTQRGSRKHKQNRKGKASTIFKKLGSASDRYQLHHDQVHKNLEKERNGEKIKFARDDDLAGEGKVHVKYVGNMYKICEG